MRAEYLQSLKDAIESCSQGLRSLPGWAYTSPEVFNIDTETIKAGWLPIIHISECSELDTAFAIDILDIPLVVTRDHTGQFHVFYRACRHRGADLLPDCVGRACKMKAMTCPYHAWTYQLDGTLKGAPFMEGNPTFNRAENGLVRVRTAIFSGFVFINISGDADVLDVTCKQYMKKACKYNLENLVLAYEDAWTLKSNWKLFAENFLESYHHIGAHSRSLQSVLPGDAGYICDDVQDSVWLCTPVSCDEGNKLRLRSEGEGMDFPLVSQFFPEDEKRNLYGVYLPPLLFLVLQPDRMLWYQLFPRCAGETVIRTKTFVHPDVVTQDRFYALLAGERQDFNDIHREDMKVLTSSFQGLRALSSQSGCLSPLELGAWGFYKKLLLQMQ